MASRWEEHARRAVRHALTDGLRMYGVDPATEGEDEVSIPTGVGIYPVREAEIEVEIGRALPDPIDRLVATHQARVVARRVAGYLNVPPTELARKVKTEKDPAKKRKMQDALDAWRTTQGNPLAPETTRTAGLSDATPLVADAVEVIDLAYRDEWGRPATREEVTAVLRAVAEGLEAEPDLAWPLNLWVDAVTEAFGVPMEVVLALPDVVLDEFRSLWDEYEEAAAYHERPGDYPAPLSEGAPPLPDVALDRFLSFVDSALEEAREDARLLAEAIPDPDVVRAAADSVRVGGAPRNPERLVIFDFDGTLFNSEERSPDWWTKPGEYSWGADPRSLEPPCVPERPAGSPYWNARVVQAAREATADRSTYVVLITGRVKAHERRILELLSQQGVRPDGVFFNPGTSAATFKKRIFGTLIIRFPYIRTLEIWENENQDVYGSFVERLSEQLERPIDLEVHRVAEKHVPATCGPQDFPEMRVASARKTARVQIGRVYTSFRDLTDDRGLVVPAGTKARLVGMAGNPACQAVTEDGALHNFPDGFYQSFVFDASRYRTAAWKETGDGKRVGVFIPIPDEIAAQFPSLGAEDDSPPHVTLLYVGEVPKAREEEFVSVLRASLGRQPGPVRAALGEPDYFVHPGHDRRVWYSRVSFSKDVGEIRDRIWLALEDAGFDVQHSFPLAFFPHATLAYQDDAGSREPWEGPVPSGSWEFSSVSVWGLQKRVEVPLGTYAPGAIGSVLSARA